MKWSFKPLYFFFFIMSFFYTGSIAFGNGFTMESAKKLYNPGDTIKFELKWDAQTGFDKGLLYVAVVTPDNGFYFLTSNGFSVQPYVPYTTLELSNNGQLSLLNFPYSSGINFPPGIYSVYALVTENDVSAISNTTKLISPLLSDQFTFTSHEIPITFPGNDPRTRLFHTLKVSDGVWIVFVGRDYISSYKGHPLYVLKLDLKGHTKIPPVLIGSVGSEYYSPYNNIVYPVVGENGGIKILARVKDPQDSYKEDLVAFELDSEGRLLKQSVLVKDRQYLGLWAVNINSVIYALMFYDDGLYLLKKQEDSFSETRISPANISLSASNSFFKVLFDKKTFYVFYGYNQDHFYFSKLNLNGDIEDFKDLSGQIQASICNSYMGWPEDTFINGDKIFFIKAGVNPLILFFDKTGSLLSQVPIQDSVALYGTGKYDVELRNNNLLVFWRKGSSEYMGAEFDLSGQEIFSPTDLYAGNKTSSRPEFVLLNPNAQGLTPFAGGLLLYSEYSQSPYSIKGLLFAHDFPAEQPDLVISDAHIIQSPEYAAPGADVELKAEVYNRGETASNPANLSLTYFGQTQTSSVDSIPPGEYKTIVFTLNNPPYLTQTPDKVMSISGDTYTDNDMVNGEVLFPPATPIYPAGSMVYSWVAKDSSTDQPIPDVYISYFLDNVQTVGYGTIEVNITHIADDMGNFQTILPSGAYTFYLAKAGYPGTYRDVQVPGTNNILYLEPPGQLTFGFQGSDGQQSLHPAPISVSVHLKHMSDSSISKWQEYEYNGGGDAGGFIMKDIMPGNYSIEAKAFGYNNLSQQIQITGGINNNVNLVFNPFPRGVVKGKIVCCEKGIKGAIVSVEGTKISTATDSDGIFSFSDFPFDGISKNLIVSADKYSSTQYGFTAQETQGGNMDLGEIALTKIIPYTSEIQQVRFALYNQNLAWGVGDSYNITNTYGVGEIKGQIQYEKIGDITKADALTIYSNGYYWNYASVGTDLNSTDNVLSLIDDCGDVVSLLELPKAVYVTINSLSDVLGTIGSLIDIGQPDVLSGIAAPDNNTSAEKITILRLDNIVLYDGNQKIFETSPQQYYSNEYQDLVFPLNGKDVSLNNLKLRIYFSTMNGNYCTAPLNIINVNKVYFEWRFQDNELLFNGYLPSPSDYPAF